MTERVLQFREGDCVINLNMPKAMMVFSATRLRKLLKIIGPWCSGYWGQEENRRNLYLFFDCTEPIKADLYEAWNEASIIFQREYRDATQLSKKEAKAARANNKKLLIKVQDAKRAYDQHLKKMEVLEELKKMYLDE